MDASALSRRSSARRQNQGPRTKIPTFLVLGSWFLVLGSWFLVLGSWFLVPGSRDLRLTTYELRLTCRLPLTGRMPVLQRNRAPLYLIMQTAPTGRIDSSCLANPHGRAPSASISQAPLRLCASYPSIVFPVLPLRLCASARVIVQLSPKFFLPQRRRGAEDYSSTNRAPLHLIMQTAPTGRIHRSPVGAH